MGNACLWNPESWTLESVIQLKESGIPLSSEIRNPQRRVQSPRLSWITSRGQLKYRQLMRKVTTQFSLGWLHVRILITEPFCTALLTKATVVLSWWGRGGGEGVSEGLALEMTASLPPCDGLARKYSCLSSLIETPTLRRRALRAALFAG